MSTTSTYQEFIDNGFNTTLSEILTYISHSPTSTLGKDIKKNISSISPWLSPKGHSINDVNFDARNYMAVSTMTVDFKNATDILAAASSFHIYSLSLIKPPGEPQDDIPSPSSLLSLTYITTHDPSIPGLAVDTSATQSYIVEFDEKFPVTLITNEGLRFFGLLASRSQWTATHPPIPAFTTTPSSVPFSSPAALDQRFALPLSDLQSRLTDEVSDATQVAADYLIQLTASRADKDAAKIALDAEGDAAARVPLLSEFIRRQALCSGIEKDAALVKSDSKTRVDRLSAELVALTLRAADQYQHNMLRIEEVARVATQAAIRQQHHDETMAAMSAALSSNQSSKHGGAYNPALSSATALQQRKTVVVHGLYTNAAKFRDSTTFLNSSGAFEFSLMSSTPISPTRSETSPTAPVHRYPLPRLPPYRLWTSMVLSV